MGTAVAIYLPEEVQFQWWDRVLSVPAPRGKKEEFFTNCCNRDYSSTVCFKKRVLQHRSTKGSQVLPGKPTPAWAPLSIGPQIPARSLFQHRNVHL